MDVVDGVLADTMVRRIDGWLQQQEFDDEKFGFRAAKHQSFVGAGYFDAVQNTIMDGLSSTTALAGSTEEEQFVA